jgi:hypothetical protein
MEARLHMPEFLDKALLLKACTNPRMPALRGRRGRLSMWTSSVWQQAEAMYSQVSYLAPFTQRISAKAGPLVIHPATARSVAASSLIRLEAARYSLAMQQECFFPPTVARLGLRLIKDFQNVPSLMSKLRAPTILTCSPAFLVKPSGASYWKVERRRRHQIHRRHQRHPRQQRFLPQQRQPRR